MSRFKLEQMLLELEKHSQINLRIAGTGLDLRVRRRRLHEVESNFSPEELIERSDRILVGRFSSSIREALRRQGISYFVPNNAELFLVENEVTILLRPNRQKRLSRRGKALRTGLSPTDIISPMGLPITDVLLRMPEPDLRSFRSANHFAKEFELYQPKLSKMMIAAGARDLNEMVEAMKKLSLDWWDIALNFPSVRRQLRPFLLKAKPYHLSDPEKFEDLRMRLGRSFGEPDVIHPGPITAAIATGHFIEDAADFWVLTKDAATQKKMWRLLPGKKPGSPTVWLAETEKSFAKEGLLTPLARWDRRLPSEGGPVRQNLLRAVWDLYQGDNRQRTAGREMLKDLLR